MKAKRFTDEQIIAVLREAEAGAKATELCRKHGISEPTFYNWKAKFAGMTDLPGFFGPFVAGEWPRSGWLLISST